MSADSIITVRRPAVMSLRNWFPTPIWIGPAPDPKTGRRGLQLRSMEWATVRVTEDNKPYAAEIGGVNYLWDDGEGWRKV